MTKLGFSTAALIALAGPALAHHALGGLPMETAVDGALSGIGHPVLGFDHLFFVVAMGVAAVFTGRAFAAPAAYIVAMLVGCGLMYSGIGLPMKEVVIVASLVVMGVTLASGRALGLTTSLVLFAGFGLFHGSAFGDSIAAQEGGVNAAVLVGYLVGLGAVQYMIAIAAGWAVSKVTAGADASAVNPRLVGAATAGVGVFLALEAIEGPLLAAIAG